ncbi:MAG: hypothetical protein KME11_09675 [Timaviella obliquedivisa GSE-PSE-MK23-08B]|jgi:hypothetical protein|nr:hypothetical protein [Timaviella obliquedivisa GSE-PSE-MK23-08B]
MFLTEITPLVKELVGQPIAFLGGFVSGLLRLNLSDDPVKSWLDQHTSTTGTATYANGRSGPQSIDID